MVFIPNPMILADEMLSFYIQSQYSLEKIFTTNLDPRDVNKYKILFTVLIRNKQQQQKNEIIRNLDS